MELQTKFQSGLKGQKAAEDYLIQKGYKVLARNYRIRTGEIDLVAEDNEYIVFVEVKFRRGLTYGLPREAVGATKQQRIIRTALHYLTRHNLTESDVRFDIVEILEQHGQLFASHIENAFGT